MFKKIALFCLITAPLVCEEKPNQQLSASTTNIEFIRQADKHHDAIISLLKSRLPRFQRTKIFFIGTLVGVAACLCVQKNYPELLAHAQTLIPRLKDVFNPTALQATVIDTNPSDNNSAPNKGGAEDSAAAEEKAAKDSKSCTLNKK